MLELNTNNSFFIRRLIDRGIEKPFHIHNRPFMPFVFKKKKAIFIDNKRINLYIAFNYTIENGKKCPDPLIEIMEIGDKLFPKSILYKNNQKINAINIEKHKSNPRIQAMVARFSNQFLKKIRTENNLCINQRSK